MHLPAHRHLLLLRDKMACISILALGLLGAARLEAARLRATCISYILGKAKSQPAAGRWAGKFGSLWSTRMGECMSVVSAAQNAVTQCCGLRISSTLGYQIKNLPPSIRLAIRRQRSRILKVAKHRSTVFCGRAVSAKMPRGFYPLAGGPH